LVVEVCFEAWSVEIREIARDRSGEGDEGRERGGGEATGSKRRDGWGKGARDDWE
jgi:hypothetical protein